MLKSLLALAIVPTILAGRIQSYGQSYEEGYVITVAGDTLRGFIRDKESGPMKRVSFKRNPSDKEVIDYQPSDVKSFYLKRYNSHYLSAGVDIDLKPTDISRLEVDDPMPKVQHRTVFLNLLIGGKASLYGYTDESNKDHYFLQMNQDKIEELDLIRYLYTKRNAVIESELYKDQLKNRLTGCDKDYTRTRFDEKSLRSVIRDYNKCVGSVSSYDEEPPKAKMSLYLMAGGVITSANFVGYSGSQYATTTQLSDLKFQPSFSPTFIIGFRAYSRKKTMSLGLEYSWKSHAYSGSVKQGSDESSSEIELAISKINLLATRHLTSWKLKPYVALGPTLALPTATKNNLAIDDVRTIGDVVVQRIQVYRGPVGQFKNGIGLVALAGISLNKLLIEGRYEFTSLPSETGGTLNLSSFNALVGYQFGKN